MKIVPQRPALLTAIQERTASIGFTMPSEAGTGELLRTLAASKRSGRMLEIGTGTGLATVWLLDGMDEQATLVSVDVDETVQAVARDILGHDSRVRFVTQDAGEFLRNQQPATFDLIFADAMIGKYELLDSALALLKPGGLYVVDDMLPQPNWPANHGPRVHALIENLTRRPDLKTTCIDWASGLVVAAVIG